MRQGLRATVMSLTAMLMIITLAQAGTINIPLVNADFNTIYAHGTTNLAWTFNWGFTKQVGNNVEVYDGDPQFWPQDPDTAFVDVPGWIGGGASVVGIKQQADNDFQGYKNGQWGGGDATGGTLSQVLPGVSIVSNNIYTLSLVASCSDWDDQVNLELWAGATPIAATDPNPVTVGTTFTNIPISKQFVVSGAVPTGDLRVVIWMRSNTQVRVDNVTLTRQPILRAVEGTVRLDGYLGDNTWVDVKFEFQRVDGTGSLTQTTVLDPDGAFHLDPVPQGIYNILVKSRGTLSAKRLNVDISTDPANLGVIELKTADINGDNQVSFEDFAVLQNVYGQRGPVVVPHVVDGVLSSGEWANLYTDPIGDTSGGVELVRWGAEVRDGTLYAAFELDHNGHTVAEYNYNGESRIWLSLWLDVDPASYPTTGVSGGDSQFSPRAQDIYVELGTDQGTLEGSNGWHSLNLWGRDNSFDNRTAVEGTFAYSAYVVEFSCPVSAILAELPNTDNAAPADLWTVAARAAGHGFGGDYSGDVTDLKSLWTSDTQSGTLGANPLVPAAAATGGCGPVGIALVALLGLAFPALGLGAHGRQET